MRYPNPWVAIPSLIAGILAGWVGYVVTDVSCRVDQVEGSCTGWAVVVAAAAFLIALVGMAVVIVLVYRSLAEAREK